MSYLFKSAILGGTFDHFHLGHEQFIAETLGKTEHLTIGIVEKSFSTDKSFTISIEDYEIRLSNLKTFLRKSGLLSRTSVIPIHDIYGTTLTDPNIEAIFVTDSTLANATRINAERQSHTLPPLQIVVVPYTIGDDNQVISSGHIRAGQIDRQGRSYLKYFLQKSIYRLPKNLRATLQRPIGLVVNNLSEIASVIPPSSLIVSVGDIVSMDLQKSLYAPNVSIVDYHTRRHALDSDLIQKHFPSTNFELSNPAGTINSKFAEIFLLSMSQSDSPQIIKVDGEEDLLALPAMLLSPLGSYVVYGQYNLGMCITIVTEELKTKIKRLLEQFA